jgi:hypothetical protein
MGLNIFKKIQHILSFNTKEPNHILSLFLEKKCLFFHIPKTAGISISNSIYGDIKWGHRTVNYYKSYYGDEVFNSLYKFCFVRNPYDRLFSAYTFLKKGGINDQDLAFSEKHLHEYLDFEDFVLRGLEKKEIMEWVHFRPQHTFVCDDNDKMVMDFVGKMENINEDFSYLCKQINVNVELKKLNMSSVKKNDFSDNIKSIIKSKYQKDFTLFYPYL